MSWYNPFNVFSSGAPSPFEIVKDLHQVNLYPKLFISEKELVSTVEKVFGKKLEKRILVIDEMMRPEPWWQLQSIDMIAYSSAKEWVAELSEMARSSKRVSGFGLSGFICGAASIPDCCVGKVEDVSEYNTDVLQRIIANAAYEYRRKSGDTSLMKDHPDECPQCNASFINKWIDQNGDEMYPITSEDGCCPLCGYWLDAATEIDLKKAYKLIRKFEESKGIRIFPRVEASDAEKAVKIKKAKAS